MIGNINGTTCDACGREFPKNKLKLVKETYKSETISRGTPGMVKNYIWYVHLCPRCRFLRKFSYVVGIIIAILYWYPWMMLIDGRLLGHLPTILNVIKFIVFGLVLNPLAVGALAALCFRIVIKCDTWVKYDDYRNKHKM